MPPALLDRQCCKSLQAAWRARYGGLSEVALYDQGRDGLGYVLKLQPMFQRATPGHPSGLRMNDDDYDPMLSVSLIEAVRRGRM